MFGWRDTGTQPVIITSGITDTGPARLMPVPPGSGLVMREDNSSRGIGTATAAGSSTIIVGTTIATAILATTEIATRDHPKCYSDSERALLVRDESVSTQNS
jgi:hypothetical protein